MNEQLKEAINSQIKENGVGEITGPMLNGVLNSMIDSITNGAAWKGIANKETNPGNIDNPVFYFAVEGGIYPNFDRLSVPTGISLIYNTVDTMGTTLWNALSLTENLVPGYAYMGQAELGTQPDTTYDMPTYYTATTKGTYSGFGITKSNEGLSLIMAKKEASRVTWELIDLLPIAQELGNSESMTVSQSTLTRCLDKKVDIKLGRNLFNIDSCVDGYQYFKGKFGFSSDGTTYGTTDYIEIKGGLITNISIAGIVRHAYYDENFKYVDNIQSNRIAPKEGAKYIRFTFVKKYSKKYLVAYGTTLDFFNEYNPIGGYIHNEEITKRVRLENIFKFDKHTGTNLVDPKYLYQAMMYEDNGIIRYTSNVDYRTTGFIKIPDNGLISKGIAGNPKAVNAYFDENFEFISSTRDSYLPKIEGAVYAKFCMTYNESKLQVNAGNVLLPYEPYTELDGFVSKKFFGKSDIAASQKNFNILSNMYLQNLWIVDPVNVIREVSVSNNKADELNGYFGLDGVLYESSIHTILMDISDIPTSALLALRYGGMGSSILNIVFLDADKRLLFGTKSWYGYMRRIPEVRYIGILNKFDNTAITYISRYTTEISDAIQDNDNTYVSGNLFSRNKFIKNANLAYSNGLPVYDKDKMITKFIRVDQTKKYKISIYSVATMCCYDPFFKFIESYVNIGVNDEISFPDGTYYVRFALGNTVISALSILETSYPNMSYVPHRESLGDKYIPQTLKDNPKKDIAHSKNLFDKSAATLNSYLAGYELVSSTNFHTSDFIRVDAGKTYSFSTNGESLQVRFLNFYDRNLIIVRQLNSADSQITRTFTTNENECYVRFSYPSYLDSLQLEEGDVTPYEPYQLKLDSDIAIDKTIAEGSVTLEQTTFSKLYEVSNNILNPADIKRGGYYISVTDGVEYEASYGQGVTDYIPIDNRGLSINGGYLGGSSIGHAVYDSNKRFIRGYRSNIIDYQEGDAFVRFSTLRGDIMVSRSQAVQVYEPYTTPQRKIDADVLPPVEDTKDNIKITLPDKMYAVVGDRFQLFYRGCIQAINPYNYYIKVFCDYGKQLPRYYELVPEEKHIGRHNFSIEVRDNNGRFLGGAKSVLEIVKSVKTPITLTNVACFGDSLTSGGNWCHEAERRLIASDGTPTGLGLSNIKFVGKKKNQGTGYFGVGGWTWGSYTKKGSLQVRFYVSSTTSVKLNDVYTLEGFEFTIIENNITGGNGNILCSATGVPTTQSGTLTLKDGKGDPTISFNRVEKESSNPLWDYVDENDQEGFMTFIPYVNTYCGGQLDVVYTLLSWNGQSAWRTDFESMIVEIEKFADTLHREYPNAKMKLMGVQVPSVTGGMGYAYGADGTAYADQYGMVVTALNMGKAYQEFANRPEYKDFVEFVNIATQFDSEYNMPYDLIDVNTRNSDKKEIVGTNGVHPSMKGYEQIGDVVFRNFIANFCQ